MDCTSNPSPQALCSDAPWYNIGITRLEHIEAEYNWGKSHTYIYAAGGRVKPSPYPLDGISRRGVLSRT
jgi:hypothetical protein